MLLCPQMQLCSHLHVNKSLTPLGCGFELSSDTPAQAEGVSPAPQERNLKLPKASVGGCKLLLWGVLDEVPRPRCEG